jgi:tetratricopeptide (TPR) repeat protein
MNEPSTADCTRVQTHGPTVSRGDLLGFPTIPGYQIVMELGRGGMGVVYQAKQQALDRLVAIKLMQKDDGLHQARFLAEGQIIAALKHPNVVEVYDFGESNAGPFIAMEYLPGGTFGDRLRAEPKLQPRDAAELIAQIAAGVGAAHANQIVHRDLKPGNVLLDANGVPKVTDFGLAKRTDYDLTLTHEAAGTPSYMAPEQARAMKFVGPPADVWSLGVMLYESLTGRKPFAAESDAALLVSIQTENPPTLRTISKSIPPDLETICLKCLEKEPERRYGTAEELCADLRRWLEGKPIVARRATHFEKALLWVRRKPAVAGLAAALAVTLILGSIVSFLFAVDARRSAIEAQRDAKRANDARLDADEKRGRAERAEKLAEAATRDAKSEAERANLELKRANMMTSTLHGIFRSADPLDIFGEDFLPQPWEATRKKTAEQMLQEFRAQIPEQADPLLRAKLLEFAGNAQRNFGRFKDSEGNLKEALAILRTHLPEGDSDRVQNLINLGKLYLDLGDFRKALDHFQEARAGRNGESMSAQTRLTNDLHIAWTLAMMGDTTVDRLFLDLIRRSGGQEQYQLRMGIASRIGLAAYYLDSGRQNEIAGLLAELPPLIEKIPISQLREAINITAQFQSAMALRYAAGNNVIGLELANGVFVKMVQSMDGKFPSKFIYRSLIEFEYGHTLMLLSRYQDAAAIFEKVRQDARDTVGLAHPKYKMLLILYGRALAKLNRTADARALFDEAIAANQERFGPDNPWLFEILITRGNFEFEHGDRSEAIRIGETIAAMLARARYPLERHGSLAVWTEAKRWIAMAPRREIGWTLYRAVSDSVVRTHGEHSRERVIVLRDEGNLQYLYGDPSQGVSLLQEAEKLVSKFSVPLSSDDRDLLHYFLARAESARGRFDKAEDYIRRGIDLEAPSKTEARRLGLLRDLALLAGIQADQGRYPESLETIRQYQNRMPSAAKWELALLMRRRMAILCAMKRHDEARDVFEKAWNEIGTMNDPIVVGHVLTAAAIANIDLHDRAKRLLNVTVKASDSILVQNRIRQSIALYQARHAMPFESARRSVRDYLIHALATQHAGDAKSVLAEASRLMTAESPGPADPFSYRDRDWLDRLENRILFEEAAQKARNLPSREQAPVPQAKPTRSD